MQNTVSAKPHPVVLFVGLKVNIGGALLNGIQQHFIDEAYDGGFICGIANIVVFLDDAVADFKVVFAVCAKRSHVSVEASGALSEFRNQLTEGVVLHQ